MTYFSSERLPDGSIPIKKDIIRPPFPMVIDNTMRTSFVTCPQRFFWEYALHLKQGKNPSVHLHAGKAFASALEGARKAFYSEGLSEMQSIAIGLDILVQQYGDFEAPHNSNKSLPRMIEAYIYYFKAFPLAEDPIQPHIGADGKPMVEFSFALPISPDLTHPETGEPLIYSGRADMIATYAGAVSIYDDKTTSQLGESWAKQWNLRSQFTGYIWAAHAFGIPATQVIVRGIAILKASVNHAQAFTVRTPHMVADWHAQIIRDISRAKAAWEAGQWDRNLADACSAFGGCPFQQACISPDPAPWLTPSAGFIRRQWNPLTHTETLLEPLENV